MKGGGDAVSAARAVLQSGEYDFAWNMQVEDEILRAWRRAAKARSSSRRAAISSISSSTHRSLDRGRRRARELKTKHPLSDPAVRQAISLLVDKDSIEKTSTAAPVPPRRTSSTTRRASSPRPPSSSSASTRPTRSSRRPAGRRVPTASARRTASSSSSTRPRSTSRARRPRRSSSRPPRRPASTSS